MALAELIGPSVIKDDTPSRFHEGEHIFQILVSGVSVVGAVHQDVVELPEIFYPGERRRYGNPRVPHHKVNVVRGDTHVLQIVFHKLRAAAFDEEVETQHHAILGSTMKSKLVDQRHACPGADFHYENGIVVQKIPDLKKVFLDSSPLSQVL